MFVCLYRKNSKLSRSAWWKKGRGVWRKGRSSAQRIGVMPTTVSKRKRHSASTRSSSRKVINSCIHVLWVTESMTASNDTGRARNIGSIFSRSYFEL